MRAQTFGKLLRVRHGRDPWVATVPTCTHRKKRALTRIKGAVAQPQSAGAGGSTVLPA